jgi:amidase
MHPPLTHLSATQLLDRLRRRELAAVEVVEAHLARIAAVNPALNAVVQLTADAARADAQRADAAAARGEWLGPLHGLPFTVKDWIETQGVICAAGYEARRHYTPPADATVVARMRAAGAILLGKTNVTGGESSLRAHQQPI